MDILGEHLFPFTLAFALVITLGLIQLLGLGLDIDVDADTDFLSWLGIGRVPLTVLAILALGIFAFTGYAITIIAADFYPGLPRILMSIAVTIPTLILSVPRLARLVPQEETSSIRLEDLVGKRARTFIASASDENPAQAKLKDHHGSTHTIWIKTQPSSPPIGPDEEVLLVSFDAKNRVFTAIPVESIFHAY